MERLKFVGKLLRIKITFLVVLIAEMAQLPFKMNEPATPHKGFKIGYFLLQ